MKDPDWKSIDRWIIGEAWVGSRIEAHLGKLCDQIGPRWASSEAERTTVDYIRDQMAADGLEEPALEEFQLDTWTWTKAEAKLVETGMAIDILPFNRCHPFVLQGPIVDVGFGTPREIDAVRTALPGSIALMSLTFEPFTDPIPHTGRLGSLADGGAAAAVVIEKKSGRRMEYHNASDWRDPGLQEHPIPCVVTSREHGALLRRAAGEEKELSVSVESRFYQAPAFNVSSVITGNRWPEEHLVLGGHHDTTIGSPGGNDNSSGTIAVMETARVLSRLFADVGGAPGRSIRFVTYSAEEQKLQGSSAYVKRHYEGKRPPRLAINLDELSTGNLKGIALGFPHLRDLVQEQLDRMGDGLKCHVMAQLDPSSDHFPYLRAGLDAAFLWRWRFHGRHPDSDFHHEPGDTSDKVNIRELKVYVGQLARILLRLSNVPPEEWPANPVTQNQVQRRIEAERGSTVRVF